MKFHGVQIQEGSSISNLTVASGTSFPASPNAAEVFFRTDSDTRVRGLYVYVNGVWGRIASADAVTVPSAANFPALANAGDLFYKDSNDVNEALYVYTGSGWAAAASGSGSTLTVTGDVTGTLTVGGSGALTLASVTAGSIVGAATDSTIIAYDSKGRITSSSTTPIAIAATQVTTGSFSDARIAQSNITQHQSALSIGAGQTTSGTFVDARIAASNVTQHQAALTILETQITNGSLLARVADNETITGSWQYNNPIVTATPILGSHATTKDYVDQAIAGLSWKNSAFVATTANITLSGAQTIDGIAVVAGNRVLVKNQSTQAQNGVYVVAAGAWTRAADFDAVSPIDEVNSAAVFVRSGTTQADTAWTQTAPVVSIGSDAMVFAQFAGSNTYIAGAGLTITGNSFDVNTASATRIVVNTDNIDLAMIGTPITALFVKPTTDAYGRVTGTTAVVASDITSLVNASYVLKAGDTMTGALTNASGFVGPLTGNASTATTLATARSISIIGDAAWTTSFDGSANTTGSLTLTSVGTPVTAAFVKPTTDAKGRVTATTPVVAGDITSLVNSTYVLKAGDTITGGLIVTNALLVTNSVNNTFGGGSGGYSSFASNLVINYIGEGATYGMVLKPATSVATTNVISFLNSASTVGSASAIGTIQHLAGNAGLNLTGTWQLAGSPLMSSATVAAIYLPLTGGTLSGKLLINTNGATSQLDLQTTSTAGYAYQRFNDASAARKLEVLYVGSTVSGNTYGVAPGHTVINTSSGVDLNFSTADVLRMTVSSSTGYVGVGTASPQTAFHVTSGNTNPLMVTRASNVAVNGASGVTIDFGALNGTTPTTSAQIGSVLQNPATTGYLYFTTLTGGSLTEKMRVGSDGKVGIGGVANAGAYLHIKGSGVATVASGSMQLLLQDTGTNNSRFGMAVTQTASTFISGGSTVNPPFIWATNDGAIETMRLTDSGFLGIGIAPAVRFHVDAGAAAELARFDTTSATGGFIRFKSSSIDRGVIGNGPSVAVGGAVSDFVVMAAVGQSLVLGSNNSVQLRMDTAGNVGIGGTPSQKLDVLGNIRIQNLSQLLWGDATVQIEGSQGASGYLRFLTGTAVERMRINGAGQWAFGGTPNSASGGSFGQIGSITSGVLNEVWIAGQYNAHEGAFVGGATTNGGGKIDLNTHSSATTSGSYRMVHESDTYGVGNLAFVYAPPTTTRALLTYTHFARFNSNGKFCIGLNGTGDPSGSRILGTAIDATGGINLYTGSNSSAYGLNVTSGSHLLFYTDNGSRIAAGNISSSGSTTSFNTTSDVRLKENIADAGSADSIIDAIQVREFDFKTGGHVRFGFVAQELVEIAPEAVTRGDDGEAISESWGVDPSKLVAMLIKEIQELRARVAVLEAK